MLQEEEQRKIDFKNELCRKLQKIFKFDISQVLALGPLVVHAMDLVKQRYQKSQHGGDKQEHGGGLQDY